MAFVADPLMRWSYPDPQEYLKQFPRFARIFGGGAFEHGTAYATEGFGGVSLWLPQGAEQDGDAIHGFLRETVSGPREDEVSMILEQIRRFHTQEPHWYLAIIGVDPAMQHQGIGAALLRHSLEPCDEQGLVAYLESSNAANLSLYQRHGFEVIGEIQAGSSPTMYPMRREPR